MLKRHKINKTMNIHMGDVTYIFENGKLKYLEYDEEKMKKDKKEEIETRKEFLKMVKGDK